MQSLWEGKVLYSHVFDCIIMLVYDLLRFCYGLLLMVRKIGKNVFFFYTISCFFFFFFFFLVPV